MATQTETMPSAGAPGEPWAAGPVPTLLRNWWVVMLRGVLLAVLGILALVSPLPTFAALLRLFALIAVVDGAVAVVTGLRAAARQERFGTLILEGLLGMALGVAVWVWPALSALMFLFLVGVWFVTRGVLQIAEAIRLRKVIRNEWLLGLSGVVSVAFGFLVVIRPVVGAVGVTWLLGFYALLFGGVLMALGVRLRSHARVGHRPAASTS